MNPRPPMIQSGVVAVLAAVSLGAACPRGQGIVTTPCTSDGDCGKGFLCHPVGKVCVRVCSQSSDCPSNVANCAPVSAPDAGATELSICKCQTDLLCGGGFTCNINVDDQCETRCVANLDCAAYGPHRKCETTTGKCVLQTCVDDPAICAAGLACDPLSRQCVVPDGG